MWPRPEWFPEARLNYTENVLATGLASSPNAIAISACREGGTDWRHLSWKDLRQSVEECASGLRNLGVRKGDRVAVVMTNCIEAVVILLAAGSLGAIFSSTAPDMGRQGIVERFLQIKPKLIFMESKVLYAAKHIDLRSVYSQAIAELREKVPELSKTVVINGPTWDITDVISWAAFLNCRVVPLTFEQVSFNHPIYILYSSGTTGAPKCIVHAGGAALLQHKKEQMLHSNMTIGSVYYGYTTTGWMMWNYLVSALALGTRIVLYDGSPLHPSPTSQLDIVDEQGVTHWGTSPKYLAALKQRLTTIIPKLDTLLYCTVSGSPLSSEICDWFYKTFPSRIGLFSGSGGTDIVGGIVGANVITAVHNGELAAASLGMKVEIWDHEGHNIEDSGEKGDLVITKPFFTMPVSFWGKSGEEKYREAYFDQYPERRVWCYEILGRSDGVLNPGGVRFGTAEIYGILDHFAEVEDCIAVGQRRKTDPDEQVLLFLKLKDSLKLDKSLKQRICNAIRRDLSARHVPQHIRQVADIPYTRNGKKIENMVKAIVSGQALKVGQSAANPECLDEYKQFTNLPFGAAAGSKL
ncbi:acetyl-CoA synthetase-like protein [Aaosphaeria arxii CBS 175.79]|uniref:Acetyl-CoA synthetase-like protein n=1 Tax=Aaosphaeria arxii CBS 175.79 TaxID=1450172 RepID=A0A6A5XFE9_9PLEO|nr:acetyl-CoA synthetase-like protein [Aaosphaeria arxii CBS 175.79]KAF2011975.1 acetyl-CoA synthetase-like protein [Aaosphaeria arxii CBS 175.79]